jgi:hypothetical protein
MSKHKRLASVLVWLAAFVITVSLAVFQRLTGPTYPLRLKTEVAGQQLSLKLLRTHGGAGGLPVTLADADEQMKATVRWRRFPTQDPWQVLEMTRGDNQLRAEIPHQPAAGKVEYTVSLELAGETVTLPEVPAVARYKSEVSAAVLIPHILAMFLSMLLATRAMLGRLRAADDRRVLVLLAMALLMLGGLLLGPLVQKQAFDAYWTGWPFGTDLTDNKTAIGLIAWLPATILALRRQKTRWSVIVGWVAMMGVFLIPHSMRGSEIDWSKQPPAATSEAAGKN